MWYDAENCSAANTSATAGICGFGLATSNDGVHWTDLGLGKGMLPFDTQSVGSGSVFKAPTHCTDESGDDVYVINYSEQGVAQGK